MNEEWRLVENLENKSGQLSEKHRRIHDGKISPRYGLCAKCANIRIIRTKLDNEQVWCQEFTDKASYIPICLPNKQDPIESCSLFVERGEMSLQEMRRIAWMIDVKQNRIGFATTNEVVVKEPVEEEE
jgi:hypothetical protein